MTKVVDLKSMREGKFQTKVLEMLKRFEPHVAFFKVVKGNSNGLPDIVGSVGGVFIAVELKVEGKKPAPLQRYWLNKITESGGLACSITPKDLPEFITEVAKLVQQRIDITENDNPGDDAS